MTIWVYGDAERAAWAEANADARDDAQWEYENLCPECNREKPLNERVCVQCMTDDEYESMLDAATGHEVRWIA